MSASEPAAPAGMQVLADKNYQQATLTGVSRSFAFTIPQLPDSLRASVTNAYLLCRVADTIEDHGSGPHGQRQALFAQLAAAVERGAAEQELAQQLLRQLSAQAPPAERELVRNLPRLLRINAALPEAHRRTIIRCVDLLAAGMARFDTLKSATGLANQALFDDYCYHVAGVVGELLTALFCDYSPQMAQRRAEMMKLAVAFGQGLQMTNILKDVWEDRAAGVCWLPRDVFARHGCMLQAQADWRTDPGFQAGMREMLANARGHLEAALQYTLLIPPQEAGIRRFCSWAAGMALLTLRRIAERPDFSAQHQVKISRRQVARIVAISNLAVHRDWTLRAAFWLAALGLPPAPPHDQNKKAIADTG